MYLPSGWITMRTPNLDLFDPKTEKKPARELASPLDNYPTIEKQISLSPTQEPPVFAQMMGIAPIKTDQNSTKKSPESEEKITTSQTHKNTNSQHHKLTNLIATVEEKPDKFASFRCPPSVLSKVDEIKYLLKKRYGIKVKDYELFGLGLADIFWDIEHGEEKTELIQALEVKSKK